MNRVVAFGVLVAVVGLVFGGGCGEPGHVGDIVAAELQRCDAAREFATTPPPTRREKIVETIHGVRVADPYRWLERAEDRAVSEWMRGQDQHARRWLSAQPGRPAIRERFRRATMIESRTAPARRGRRLFYARWSEQADRPTYFVSDLDGRHEQILVDPNKLGAGASLRDVRASDTGRYATYLLGHNAADHATLVILDLESGTPVVRHSERIAGARYAQPSWRPDDSGFYYTALPDDQTIPAPELPGHAEVKFHEMGTNPTRDATVYGPLHNPRTFVFGDVSDDGEWLVITVSRGFAATDVYFRQEAQRDAPLSTLAVGRNFLYGVQAHGDRFYVHTNEGAPRFRVLEVDPSRPARDLWREVVPQQKGTLRLVQVMGGRFALSYLERAHSKLEFRDLDGTHPSPVALPGVGTTFAFAGDPERKTAYVSFTSFTEPLEILELSTDTGHARRFWRRPRPLDGGSQTEADIEVEQVWYASADGTPISMFVARRGDSDPTATHPTMLTGYGGFGVPVTPTFSVLAAEWIAAGGVWAVPNLRGGGEYGEDWHEAGKLHAKQNTFDDFIGAAQWLIGEGFTQPHQLAIRGGSNGGLLVGAVMTQRPELFGAVVCGVPLLDMVRYTKFGSGPTWIGEYGDPADPEAFATLFAYSPYHRLADGVAYPPLLMLSADSDDRVDPMHARKFVAQLRWSNATTAPALLRIEANAGHGGSDRRPLRIEEAVDVWSFLSGTTGVPNAHFAPPDPAPKKIAG